MTADGLLQPKDPEPTGLNHLCTLLTTGTKGDVCAKSVRALAVAGDESMILLAENAPQDEVGLFNQPIEEQNDADFSDLSTWGEWEEKEEDFEDLVCD